MILDDISFCVQEGGTGNIAGLVARAIQEDHNAEDILRRGLVKGILEAEKRFNRNEILDSEVLLAERTLKLGLEILMPIIKDEPGSPIGTAVTGTTEGDIRETEKNIISVMMRSMGLRVIDLGTSIPVAHFIQAAAEEKAQVIACTASLTTFLPQMKSLVLAAGQAGLRAKTKILVCGRPVTVWFSKSINADMYAPDPVQAAEITAEYCEKCIKL